MHVAPHPSPAPFRRRRLASSAALTLTTAVLLSTLVPAAANSAQPTSPPESLTSAFTPANGDGTSAIAVDGLLDAGYPTGGAAIDNAKDAAATADIVTSTAGTLRSAWDGSVLYLFVDVADTTPSYNATLPAWGASSATNFDGVEFAVDFWNDKVDKFQDDDGLFTISRDGKLTYVPNAGVINHQSVHAFRDGREYTDRIRDFAVTDTATGYSVELAFQLGGANLTNGTSLGIDAMIGDSTATGAARSARVYWSHQDNAYPASSQDHPVDWGNVTLGGWNGTDRFAFNDWSLTNPMEWARSIRLVKGVWTASTQAELDAALANGDAVLSQIGSATDAAAQAAIDAAATRVRAAIAGLRWADSTYPDPMDLPSQLTLPDPWTFFDGSPVESPDDWWGTEGRRAELLDLAQFYEYGYKPGAPDAFTVTGIREVPASPGLCFGTFCFIPPSPAHPAIDVSISYDGITAPMSFDLFVPSADERAASGHADGPVPVVLSFGGYIPEYTAAGYAVLNVPTSVTTDDRNAPWTTRSGTFRTFFPYSRDGDTDEVSNEMAAAWGASRAIDALELVVDGGTPLLSLGAANEIVSADDLVVTGFSINGKYAFVSGVFDDRIDVTIPSAAGATGPAPYRYASSDPHVYSWGTSGGSEVMGDTIRHNPGRTTELFRRFLEPGRFYERQPGSWGYGDRLPFDQNDLVATLAPRALVLNSTVDDYSDNSESDGLSLTVAKITYEWLGYEGDDLLKFNYRPTGGHGEDAGHRQRAAEYLDEYFYDTAMSEEVATHLNTNPFLDDGTYDTYFGGLETIAPWMHSRDITMTAAVEPGSLMATTKAPLTVKVTGSNLKGRALTARLLADGTAIAETTVTATSADATTWTGTFDLDPVPAAGPTYSVVVTVAGQDAVAQTGVTVVAYSAPVVNPAPIVPAPGDNDPAPGERPLAGTGIGTNGVEWIALGLLLGGALLAVGARIRARRRSL